MRRHSIRLLAVVVLGWGAAGPAFADVPPSDAGEPRDDDGGCQTGGAGAGGAATFALLWLATRRRRD